MFMKVFQVVELYKGLRCHIFNGQLSSLSNHGPVAVHEEETDFNRKTKVD